MVSVGLSFQLRQRLKEQLCKSICLSVCLFVCLLPSCLNSSISPLCFSLCSLFACQLSHQSMLGHQAQLHLSSSCQLSHQSMLGHQAQLHLSLAIASYPIRLCQAIRFSSKSPISLVYVRPSAIASSLFCLCLVSLQSLTSLQ